MLGLRHSIQKSPVWLILEKEQAPTPYRNKRTLEFRSTEWSAQWCGLLLTLVFYNLAALGTATLFLGRVLLKRR